MSNTKAVYTIVERSRAGNSALLASERKLWLRIGNAAVNPDGSIDVTLDAMPANGTLRIRDMPEVDHKPKVG